MMKKSSQEKTLPSAAVDVTPVKDRNSFLYGYSQNIAKSVKLQKNQ
jgi:hypothetical protein